MQTVHSPINGFIPLRNDANGIFFHVPHGLPDPAQECPIGPDMRRRVKREGAAQSLCFYVASQNICRYIGPNFCEPLKEKFQRFETALNAMQRSQATYEASIFSCNQLFSTYNNEALKQYDKEKVRVMKTRMEQFLQSPKIRKEIREDTLRRGESFNEQKLIEDTPGQIALLKDFLAQDTFHNVFDYCRDLKLSRRFKIQLGFLAAIGMKIEEIINGLLMYSDPVVAAEFKKVKSYKELDCVQAGPRLQNAVQLLAFTHFDLKFSEWSPNRPFSVLFNLLKQAGPLGVSGKIGCYIYPDKPKQLDEKWGDRNVFGWAAGSVKGNIAIFNHIVTVIGAQAGPEKAGFGYVYFLDPINPSDPTDPTLDKIYKISYKNLQESAAPFSEYYENGHYAPSGFAWHRKCDLPL